MAKFKLTNSAVNDLTDIWDYTVENWSVNQAEKYYNLLIESCKEIAKMPKSGKDYNEIYPELKGVNTSKHIIFYRIMDDYSIEVARILHERMDLKNKLKD